MSLKGWIAKRYVIRMLKQLEKEGKMDWFFRNKAKVGAILTTIVQALRWFPEVPSVVIEVLTAVTAFITGTGVAASDVARKEFGASAK